jgi:hypothetical protein
MSQPTPNQPTPSQPELPGRDDVIAMLASFGQRAPEEVAEQIGSLELTWLITQAELRYRVMLELSDEILAQMATVSGAVTALRDALPGAEHV